jgi:hypothetical protein
MRERAMENSGRKAFFGLILSGLALLAIVVAFVVYGGPVGGNTDHLNIGMPKPTLPKKN